MKTTEIRRLFLDFFREREHRIVPSSSLIPDDPTLLLTAAGMVQFKPYFLGQKKPDYKRAASIQKCARTTDIDQVGLTARHLSFFEMLGNFSFGDYFKQDACAWAWELATSSFGLDPDLLWVTVFETDDEAEEIWRDHVGVAAERVVRRGREDNFWWMGVPGPSGPCSEIFFDRGPQFGHVEGFQDGDRIMEFWNLVFMQDICNEDGEPVSELPSKNIDTGAGLERTAMIMQGVGDAYHTDELRRILEKAESITGHRFDEDPKIDVSLRIISEHARSASMLIADGVFPSNEERGYVLRRIIRRAIRHARILGADRPVMQEMAGEVIDAMGEAYPDLVQGRAFIEQTLAQEEEHFSRTLRQGLVMLEDEIGKVKSARIADSRELHGDVAFKLHDTYGFPVDLTVEIAKEHGLDVNRSEFERLMGEQRDRARQGREKVAETQAQEDLKRLLTDRGATKFLGYERDETDSVILSIIRSGATVAVAAAGDDVEVLLDATPFYAEAGGQVGDRGTIAVDGGLVEVSDTQKAFGDLVLHHGRVVSGEIRTGAQAHAAIDLPTRTATMRSHSATHVLHWALRHKLGPHARQAGSLVAPGRLRFDFPHTASVPHEILREVESDVNNLLSTDSGVRAFETTMDYARNIGAVALFGEKYGDIVRVVEIGDYSIELCGGTHVSRTTQVGPLVILGEASIGSNLRRIEALTGHEALENFRKERAVLESIATLLRTTPDEAPARVQRMLEELKAAQQELDRGKQAQTRGAAGELASTSEPLGDARVVVAEVKDVRVDALQKLAVAVRDTLQGTTAVVLASASDGRAGIVAAVSKDLASRGISAKALIADAARAIGGGAGGKDEVATGGGSNAAGVGEALRLAKDQVRRALGA